VLKFCPTCNRSSNDIKFIGEFCEVCTINRVKKGLKDSANLNYCKRCNRIETPLGHRALTNEALGIALAKAICNSKCEVKVESFDKGRAKVLIKNYKLGLDSVDFPFEIRVKLQHRICQDDYRKSSGYYEAIIQLRESPERSQRLLKKIDGFLKAHGAFIGRIEKTDNEGLDIYASDKKLVSEFFMKNRIKTKNSYTLYSIKGGKKVYRNTYLVQL
jgi:NMD protein affecting ribosome stability and mRNA decay